MSGSFRPDPSTETPYSILFVTHTSEWIGPNISLLELVTRLPAGLSPRVVVPGPSRFTEELERRGVPVHSLRRLDKYGIPALVRLIQREGISLVYGNSAHGVSRNALIAAKFCNVPFVYHLREMAGSGLRQGRRLFPWADSAIAVSRAAAESYQGRFRAPPRVVYNGISPEKFSMDRASCRREVASEFGIDEAAPIVIHVGNVYKRKGQLAALEAFRELQPAVPGCALLIVGRLDRDPAYVESLRSSISEYCLEDRVIVAGLRADVGRLLAAADVFLHTALEDPHPRAVIEAMAAGLPVVAVDVDGVSESVVDGETGFLVPLPGGHRSLVYPLERLLLDPELRRTMGESGQDRAKRLFSADRTAREVAGVIQGLVGPR